MRFYEAPITHVSLLRLRQRYYANPSLVPIVEDFEDCMFVVSSAVKLFCCCCRSWDVSWFKICIHGIRVFCEHDNQWLLLDFNDLLL